MHVHTETVTTAYFTLRSVIHGESFPSFCAYAPLYPVNIPRKQCSTLQMFAKATGTPHVPTPPKGKTTNQNIFKLLNKMNKAKNS